MNAWRVHEFGHFLDSLVLESCADPEPSKAGVVVEVRAAGVNFADIETISGRRRDLPSLPFVPGIEAVGRVVETGASSHHRIGDRVLASSWQGAFGELMAVGDPMCLPISRAIDDVRAVSLLVSYQTAYFGLVHRAKAQTGETVLVHAGATDLGPPTIQLAKTLGLHVIATVANEAERVICMECGANNVVNYRKEPLILLVNRLTSGRGADIIFDSIGGGVFEQSLDCLAYAGRLIVAGFRCGLIPEIDAGELLPRNISVMGLDWGNYFLYEPGRVRSANEHLQRLCLGDTISPVIGGQYSFDQIPTALENIGADGVYGKLAISHDDGLL
jgi:NADPH:quinone reductase